MLFPFWLFLGYILSSIVTQYAKEVFVRLLKTIIKVHKIFHHQVLIMCTVSTAISISTIALLVLLYLCVLHGQWEMPMKRKMLGNESILKRFIEDLNQILMGLNIVFLEVFSLPKHRLIFIRKDQCKEIKFRKEQSPLILHVMMSGYFFFNQFKKKCKDEITGSLKRTKLDQGLKKSSLTPLQKEYCVYVVTNNENIGNNLSSFSNFPTNIDLGQRRITSLAYRFRYSGNGINDELICNVCGFRLNGWSTNTAPVMCSNCLDPDLTSVHVAGVTVQCAEEDTGSSEFAPSAQTGSKISADHCDGVCGDPHCGTCTTQNTENQETLTGNQRPATTPEASLPLPASAEALETIPSACTNTSLCPSATEDIDINLNTEGFEGNDGQLESQPADTNDSPELMGRALAESHLRLPSTVVDNSRQPEQRRKGKHKLLSDSASSVNKNQFTLQPQGIVPCPKREQNYLHYAVHSNRQQSYADFPAHLQHLVPKMIKTGFYYEGVGDFVCCFYCTLRLKCWDEDDDPFVEHARFSPFCDFLRNVEGDKFVSRVQNAVAKPYLQDVKIWCDASPNTTTMDDDGTCEPETDDGQMKTVQERRDGITCCQCEESNCCTFVPCGHLTHCQKCSSTFKECPHCGTKIEERIKTFLS